MDSETFEIPLTPQGVVPIEAFTIHVSKKGDRYGGMPGIEMAVVVDPQGKYEMRFPTPEDWTKVRARVVEHLDLVINGPAREWTNAVAGIPGMELQAGETLEQIPGQGPGGGPKEERVQPEARGGRAGDEVPAGGAPERAPGGEDAGRAEG